MQKTGNVEQNLANATSCSYLDSIPVQEAIIYDDEKHPLILVQDSTIIKYYMLDGTATDAASRHKSATRPPLSPPQAALAWFASGTPGRAVIFYLLTCES